MSADVLSSLKISETKKKVFIVRDEAFYFLGGSKLQPAKPIGNSGPAGLDVG